MTSLSPISAQRPDEAPVSGWCGPVLTMGGLRLSVTDRAGAAQLLDQAGSPRRAGTRPPLYVTSANGEVLTHVAASPAIRDLFACADVIHADGQAMVIASRLWHARPLPERVATTDLFHDVARLAERSGTSFYLLGGTEPIMAAALAAVRQRYPALRIAGARHGYIAPHEEAEVVATIAAAKPGILWVGMGVPREQAFAVRNRLALQGVGAIKTSGGLFDFLSGRRRRAPLAMQKAGFEWLYRAMLEPRRLGRRYLTTNHKALAIMLTPPARGSEDQLAPDDGQRGGEHRAQHPVGYAGGEEASDRDAGQ